MCRRRFWIAAASGLLVLLGTIAASTAAAGIARVHRAALCAIAGGGRFELDPHPPRGVDPLTGARFFLDGPGTNRGFAASAMAQIAGRDPNSFGNVGWPGFERWLSSRRLSPGAAHQVDLLAKIGGQPEVKRFSVYSAGGGPGAIYSQVQKLLCRMQATDPSADALISTYFLKHSGSCPTLRESPSDQSVFRRHIDELAAGIGGFPSAILLETDAVDTAGCLSPAGLRDRETLLAYAIDRLSKLPHAVVYVEAGTEDAETPQYAARVLNAIGIQKIRGFFLNDTHFNWTANEARFGHRVSQLTHGAHFIVGTQDNGRGPLLNPDPVRQGIEDLCNPPGRGLGPTLTTATGFSALGADAFMWVGVPGRSAGPCHRGDAAPGEFDLGFALQLAKHANQQLGPGYPAGRGSARSSSARRLRLTTGLVTGTARWRRPARRLALRSDVSSAYPWPRGPGCCDGSRVALPGRVRRRTRGPSLPELRLRAHGRTRGRVLPHRHEADPSARADRRAGRRDHPGPDAAESRRRVRRTHGVGLRADQLRPQHRGTGPRGSARRRPAPARWSRCRRASSPAPGPDGRFQTPPCSERWPR